MRTHTSWPRAIVVASMILVNGLLGGCETHTPSADDLAAIRDGKETLVLIRLACGDPQHELPKFVFATDNFPFADFNLGYLDEDGHPRQFNQLRHDYLGLSKVAWNEGWFALLRPPGYQYLTFGLNPSRVDFISIIPVPTPAKLSPEAPYWRIEVPTGTPVIYAGTFRALPCAGDDSFWGPGPIASARRQFSRQFGQNPVTGRVEDEREAAAAVIRRDLPTLPPPVTRLAVLQTGPFLHGVPPSDPEQ